ncbi:MAG TPA: phospholipase D-like domain-containing protein [Mycobacteriales bacterium]|nr:phospholipase D-like domain-containing protein [Mycobacteriales bacterium]
MTQTVNSDARSRTGLDPHALRRRLEALLGIPATEGNALTVFRNGDDIFPAMLDAVATARRSVDFCTFVYWRGDIAHEFAHALADRASAGVRVRVLIDSFGGRLIDPELIEHMIRCGVEVRWFRELRAIGLRLHKHNHRGHRKVLVCDESVAFTGGVGIAEEWCGDARGPDEWRDTHFRLTGPAVDGVRAAFAQNWAEAGGELGHEDVDRFDEQPQPGDSVIQVVRGSATPAWGDISMVFRIVLESAQERVRITTAYFNPDAQFRDLLAATVDRGVEVDILLPGPHHDKRVCQLATESTYAELVSRGVRLWNFQPTMLHAKVLTVDRAAAVIGSSNFNRRSFNLDEELVLTVFDADVVALLDDHFEDDLRRSERITPRRWKRRPVRQRVAEQLSRVGGPWF